LSPGQITWNRSTYNMIIRPKLKQKHAEKTMTQKQTKQNTIKAKLDESINSNADITFLS